MTKLKLDTATFEGRYTMVTNWVGTGLEWSPSPKKQRRRSLITAFAGRHFNCTSHPGTNNNRITQHIHILSSSMIQNPERTQFLKHLHSYNTSGTRWRRARTRTTYLPVAVPHSEMFPQIPCWQDDGHPAVLAGLSLYRSFSAEMQPARIHVHTRNTIYYLKQVLEVSEYYMWHTVVIIRPP